MAECLTVAEVYRMQFLLIERFGGVHGVRDKNAVEAAVSREIPSELPPLPQWSCNSRSGPGKRRLQPRSCREHRERRRIFRSAETACGTLLLRSGIPPFTWRAVRVGRGCEPLTARRYPSPQDEPSAETGPTLCR